MLFAHGRGRDIRVLRRIKLPHSLGQFYSAATNFLGFDMFAGDEYKVMGMAGWGEPAFHDVLSREVVVCDGPGSFRLDVTFMDHHLAKHHRYTERAVRLFGPPRRSRGRHRPAALRRRGERPGRLRRDAVPPASLAAREDRLRQPLPRREAVPSTPSPTARSRARRHSNDSSSSRRPTTEARPSARRSTSGTRSSGANGAAP